jgi:hypothetical protein
MTQYSASINFNGEWIWLAGTRQPPVNADGKPIFQKGDTLQLSQDGHTHQHQLHFTKFGATRWPFVAPHDGDIVRYDAAEKLTFAQPALDTGVLWQFEIFRGKEKTGVDPEFQVGPGIIEGDAS